MSSDKLSEAVGKRTRIPNVVIEFCLMERTMSNISDTSRGELSIDELDAVSGGSSDIGKQITKAVDDAIASTPAPPSVWVGCAWVPQWW